MSFLREFIVSLSERRRLPALVISQGLHSHSIKRACFSLVNLPLSVRFSDPTRDHKRVEENFLLPYGSDC